MGAMHLLRRFKHRIGNRVANWACRWYLRKYVSKDHPPYQYVPVDVILDAHFENEVRDTIRMMLATPRTQVACLSPVEVMRVMDDAGVRYTVTPGGGFIELENGSRFFMPGPVELRL